MWTFFKILAALVLIAIAAAYFTKPDQARAEAALKDQLLMALAREDIGGTRGAAGNLALIGCKLKPQSCFELVRSGIDAKFQDHVLYTTYDIAGFGKTANCIGAFTTFLCPGGLKNE